MLISRTARVFLCLLWVSACDGESPVRHDAGPPGSDGGFVSTDAGAREDASLPVDGGSPGTDAAPLDPCEDVECGAGECVASDGAASCSCDAGFHAEGLVCRADPCEGDDCPRTVAEWRTQFDERWEDEDEDYCMERALSGGAGQEHYFLAACIDGLVSMWRATGDHAYLDTTLELVQHTLDDAELDSDGYRYWPGPDDGHTYPLWDSFYWRQVLHMVRVLHDNPDVRATADYEERYQELLAFSEEHIWNKWAERPNNLYRSRTHMATHWARMGMDLFLITGESHYREVFDNISFGEMPGRPSNLREQFRPNPDHPNAYIWSSTWGDTPDESIQDVPHADEIISFIASAYDNDMYWTEADIRALSATLMEVVWDPALDGAYHQNVDGTEFTSGGFTQPYGQPGKLGARMHEWLVLGRYDAAIQERIETQYVSNPRNLQWGVQILGIAALNARILADGAPVF